MQTYDTATRNTEDAEIFDYYIFNAIAKGTNTEQNIRIMEEAIISACTKTFGCRSTINNNKKENSVPWCNVHLTVLRKKVNANRRLFQRTKNDDTLREIRKAKYKEAKRSYQHEISKAKSNSWK